MLQTALKLTKDTRHKTQDLTPISIENSFYILNSLKYKSEIIFYFEAKSYNDTTCPLFTAHCLLPTIDSFLSKRKSPMLQTAHCHCQLLTLYNPAFAEISNIL